MAWNEPGGNKNPWDRKPSQGGPTDLDEVVRSWQRRLTQMLGGQGRGPAGGPTRVNWVALLVLFLAVWATTGFYRVGAAERGVVTRFGKYVETTLPAWHWRFPWPIESVQIVDVARVESIDDKTRMLTADENLVDITVAVQYLRQDPVKFLFNVRDPEETLRDVMESAIREIIGQSPLEAVLGAGRQEITERTQSLVQRMLDFYETGIIINTVNLTAVSVPEQVAPSQRDAIKAREDRDRYSQEAQAYANEIVPRARGDAKRYIEDAEAYKARVVAEAQGETARFGQQLAAYERAPGVTRDRLYLDALEYVLSRARKVIVDTAGNNVMYLPLDKYLQRGGTSGSDPAALLAPGAARAAEQPQMTPDPRARGER